MKIWVTFDTVEGLLYGGLERCNIWWQKPQYVYIDRSCDYQDRLFGKYPKDGIGIQGIGWRYAVTMGKETSSVSLGKIFDFEGDICNLVWDELCKFFKSEELLEWDVNAKKYNLQPKDFILELDVDFKLSTNAV